MRQIAQFIEFGVEAGSYDITFAYRSGRILGHSPLQSIKKGRTSVDGSHHGIQRPASLPGTQLRNRAELGKPPLQLHYLPGQDLSCRRTGDYPFQITYIAYKFLKG